MTPPDDSAGDDVARDIEALAHLLDARFRVPGTGFRFGLDGLVGLVPGIGDAATGAIAFYIIVRAAALGAPVSMLAVMVFNVLIDAALGAVPLLGDMFDFAFKANLKNLEMLKRHITDT